MRVRRVALAWGLWLCLLTSLYATWVSAAAPQLLRTPGFEAPVRGDPDDLLSLPGSGFASGDRVVYAQVSAMNGTAVHPAAIPQKSSAMLGTATVIQTGPYALTVKLPEAIQSRHAYLLWVVSASGEWSMPVSINDARPLWITPEQVQASADALHPDRYIRIVGRNLAPAAGGRTRIRLSGPSTYLLSPSATEHEETVADFVAEGTLPAHLIPGSYSVAVSRDGKAWTAVDTQSLEVQKDPQETRTFTLGDPRFGACHPDDGRDDGDCLAHAIAAAQAAGRGVVFIPAGTWDIFTRDADGRGGFQLPPDIHLRGQSAAQSVILRHGAQQVRPPGALLILSGSNSIRELTFSDNETYESIEKTRPVIQLGTLPSRPDDTQPVDQIEITNNVFHRVGRAIVDGTRPIRHLVVTHNVFEAYDNAIYLSGNRTAVSQRFQVDDSVVRWNRFRPGSFPAGAIASQIGASRRLDFSSNVADGTETQGLQTASDPTGWGAGFFWNILGSQEYLLVADNHISCPGDTGGNGEAIAFDDNGNTSAFDAAQTVSAAGRSWIKVAGPLLQEQFGVKVPLATYYAAHWIQVVQGPGTGQTRRIGSYRVDNPTGGVTFQVIPQWDVIPVSGQTRVGVGKQFWQVYTIGNRIDQSGPRCRKANPTGPRGGQIAQWGQTADAVIAGNHLIETSGIQLQHIYSVTRPSCATCPRVSMFQTSVEVTGNVISGEYLWDSDCSESGIMALFGASATPESPPPLVSFGIAIGHNTIAHADGSKGGAIDITTSWADGPAPYNWPLVQNPLIFHNDIRDIAGSLPAPMCRRPMKARIGIHIGEGIHVRDAVLYKNICHNVDVAIVDDGKGTVRECAPGIPSGCECDDRARGGS